MNVQDTGLQKSAAESLLARLADRGIAHVFAIPGTDFAPIIEALSRDTGPRRRYPRFMVVPHENVAMAMAQGYYRIAGKPAAVMVHVTVGTANTICGLINAARDNVPILLAAGRTPLTEAGHIASRNRPIHWGQESFDQGGMVREYVKWDYELRGGQPPAAVIDRALDIAMSEPRGPVYLTLPREVLADQAPPARRADVRPLGATAPAPDQAAIAEAAKMIAGANFPLIVTSSAGRSPQAFEELAKLAQEFAIPVVQAEATDLNLPTDHPMHVGFDVGKVLARADVVLALDAAVPWMPKLVKPAPHARVIHLSPDPLLARFPFREYETDLLITGASAAALPMLGAHLRAAGKASARRIEARRKEVAVLRTEMLEARRQVLDKMRAATPVSPALIASCLNELKKPDAVVINELGLPVGQLDMTAHGSYMGGQLAGGLGFGLGAALGAKLAAPQREVIAVVGDGSYMFGNPLPAHFVARAESLPTLTVIANNQTWHAVRAATQAVYPDGHAVKSNTMPLVALTPAPDYERVVETCGGVGYRVTATGELKATLAAALEAVRAGKPAVVNVFTQPR